LVTSYETRQSEPAINPVDLDTIINICFESRSDVRAGVA
jgi:hypothetical protein